MITKLDQMILKARTISDYYVALKARKLIDSPRFLTVETDITNLCNIRCRMCYYSFFGVSKRSPVHMRPEAFMRIADALFSNTKSLTLSLGSESLCSPYFKDILKIASRYEIPEINFSTNGMLLSELTISEIIDLGVTEVIISVDGAKKETYEYIRRGASFDLLLKNVRRLVEIRKAKQSLTPHIRFDTVLMKRNISELVDLVILAADLGITALNFAHLVVWKGLGMESESLIHSKKLSNFWVAKAKQKAQELGLVIAGSPNPFEANGEEKGVITAVRNSSSILSEIIKPFLRPILKRCFGNLIVKDRFPDCLFPFNHISINSGGHILLCPFSHGQPPLSSMTENLSFEQIWFSRKLLRLRKNILSNNPPRMCRMCSFLGLSRPNRTAYFKPREFL